MKKTFAQKIFNVSDKISRIRTSHKENRKINVSEIINRERMDAMIDFLFDHAYTPVANLNIEAAYVSREPLKFEQRFTGRKIENIRIGDVWAHHNFDCAWFHITGRVPYDSDGKRVVYLLNLGGEGLICKADGTAVQSITCSASEFEYSLGFPVKRVVDDFSENGIIDFWVDAAANDLFGNLKNKAAVEDACIAVCNENIRALAYDLQVLISVYDTNPDDEFTSEIYNKCKSLQNIYINITDDKAADIRKDIAPLLDTKNNDTQFEYFAEGHAHLDLAWKWPIRESKRKGARTFSTQLHNIEKYPDYIFGASQAQLYEWIKEDYPQIYKRVFNAAKTPNWDVQGATWVEMDSNLISGESMIRQFYYGKKFFREEFGQDMKILWLPDSFGYSACLPQVMKLAGVPYFLTQKMSWNTVNKFPYHTFKWQSPDGSEVFAHMLPDETYNGPVKGSRLKFGEKNYQERAISNHAMMLYGIGDGGAGPGYEHIERMHRFNNLSHMPKVTPKKALDSFKILDDGKTDYPTHIGELYLEKHQGTYTTQSKNKKYNRKCEFALKNYEYLMLFAKECKIDVPVSSEELEKIWKEVLLYQFHDILPGSSINRVYDESVARYEKILTCLNEGIENLSNKLFGKGLLNLNSFAQSGIFKLNGSWYYADVPAMGFLPVSQMKKIRVFTVKATNNTIENEKLRVKFKDGCIVSLFDKTCNREFVQHGKKMGVFSSYTDIGDCWDIRPVNYQKSRRDAKCTSFETKLDGARTTATAEFKLGASTIKCSYILVQNSEILEMEVTIDCHQKNKMMRVEFPVTVISDECSFNVPFGHIKRATTENNSVEKAQYEVSGQKFVDISDDKYGISIINDCKYGYRCKGSSIDIDLIRSPLGGPGENVDQGIHTLKLAVYTHGGKLSSDTYKYAYQVNNEMVFVTGIGSLEVLAPFKCDNNDIILESVKISDDKTGAVLRLYNCSDRLQKCSVSFDGYEVSGITDIMEDEMIHINGMLEFRPFELKLIKVIKLQKYFMNKEVISMGKIRLNENAEIVKMIREGLAKKGGYCPCKVGTDKDIKCICKEFREQIADPDFEGYCHCGLYYKEK